MSGRGNVRLQLLLAIAIALVAWLNYGLWTGEPADAIEDTAGATEAADGQLAAGARSEDDAGAAQVPGGLRATAWGSAAVRPLEAVHGDPRSGTTAAEPEDLPADAAQPASLESSAPTPVIVPVSRAPTTEELARQAVELRQSLLKLLGWAMSPLGGMLRNRLPFDADEARESAERIEALAPLIPELFATDTREADLRNEALDAIWTRKADFDARAADLRKAAAALAAAARSGDRTATLEAAGAVGQACGACHDAYRSERE